MAYRGIAAATRTALNALLTAATTEEVVGQIMHIPSAAPNEQWSATLKTIEDPEILSTTVTITSAELLALNATPKTAVAAPGAGYAWAAVSAQVLYDYNSAAYAGIAAGEDLAIRSTDGSGAIQMTIETTGLLDATTDQYRYQEVGGSTITLTANAALVIHLLSGEITTGNSPLVIKLRYKKITLAI